VLNKLKIALQYGLPKTALTQYAGQLANYQGGALTTFLVKRFIKTYNIDMSEAKHADPAHYKTFNDFFTRELRDGVRQWDENSNILAHPADARVSQCGTIKEDLLFQAKGHYFTLTDLLGGDDALATEFEHGDFATLYLSPKDYHRVHMPCDGTLRQMIHIPGELFSVNPLTAENVPNLFARNERLVCLFDTEHGPFVQILVGATIVGSIETVWEGVITPPRTSEKVRYWHYPAGCEDAIKLKKGDEMGRFKLGSTVINVFSKGQIAFDDTMKPSEKTQLGTAYAHWQK
jgi:phosphatidylserine decarboxylase